ncbi:HAD hydrolase-like protein [Candidatus Woesearchaeota archaeon]|nr:HAD hydrolase-like protein [Candidatus Woesearchaeota archaeon]
MTHIIFDLDNTLVDTARLKPYMNTRAGRQHVAANISRLPTELCHPALEELIDVCEKYGDTLSVVTNSPQDYARAILGKHRILQNADIYANAHKPSSAYLELAVQMSGVPKKETVLVGDSAVDILAAHAAEITSIAAAGGYSSQDQLELAEPNELVTDPALLLDALTRFENGEFGYEPRTSPDDFDFLPEDEFETPNPDIKHLFLGTYYPWSDRQRFNEFSARIIRFKNSKDFSLKEINSLACDQYFAGGRLRKGHVYKTVLLDFVAKMRSLLEEMDIDGNVLCVASPNSFPEFCYKTDVNQVFLQNVLKNHPDYELSRERVLSRVFPKLEAHTIGSNSPEVHYRTVGFSEADLEEYDAAVLFDDVFTSGTQVASLAKMLRYFGFAGEFYAVTLGKTREE